MFDNLSQRERILALLVGSLVPMAILFVGVFWFIGKYNDNSIQISGLIEQDAREGDKMLAAKKAEVRRNYYRAVSLPSNIVNASNEYQDWLLNLVRDELKMDFRTLTPRDAGDLKYQTKLIGRAKTYTLAASADLEQLTRFLHEFYSVDLLHRINSLKINPSSTAAEGGKKIRTGKLSLIISIEVLSLNDAEKSRDFTNEYRQLARSAEEYQTTILRRNIFGPANNTPILAVRPSSSYTSETEIKISVTANDADENDLLSFELLESSVEGTKLVQADGKDRRASLEIPGQKAGQYEFKVAVRDSGFPAKQNEETLTVTVKDRIVETPPAPPPPKPKFLHAKETRITGIVKDISDQWIVWIKVRTTGERFQLKEGETFQLDDKTWTVHSIGPHHAVMQVDNRLLTFQTADPFDSPRESVEVQTSIEAKVERDTQGDAGLDTGETSSELPAMLRT